jgi:hypothetical protein
MTLPIETDAAMHRSAHDLGGGEDNVGNASNASVSSRPTIVSCR